MVRRLWSQSSNTSKHDETDSDRHRQRVQVLLPETFKKKHKRCRRVDRHGSPSSNIMIKQLHQMHASIYWGQQQISNSNEKCFCSLKWKKNSITRKRERSSNKIWTNGGQMFFGHLTQHKEKSTGNAQHPRSVFLRNTNHKGALPHFTAKLSGQAKHDLSWQRQQQSNNWSPEKTGRSAAPPPPGGDKALKKLLEEQSIAEV